MSLNHPLMVTLRSDVRRLLEQSRGEIGVLAILMLFAGGLLGFLGLSDTVSDGHTVGFDNGIMSALRQTGNPHLPIGPDWLRAAAIDITALGSITDLMLIVLAVVGLFAGLKRWREAAMLLVLACGGVALSGVLKRVFERDRPPLAYHVVEVINSSFPSGHAMLSAIVYLTLAAILTRYIQRGRVKAYVLTCGVAATIMIGLSRVYLGVHWPTDVLAGWCVGAAWAMGGWLAAWALDRWAPQRTRPALNSISEASALCQAHRPDSSAFD